MIRTPKLIKWLPPPTLRYALNSDGYLTEENSGCGGVFRDVNGRSTMAFSVELESTSILRLELTVIKIGMELARLGGSVRIQLRVNSTLAIDIFNMKVEPTWRVELLKENISVNGVLFLKRLNLYFNIEKANMVADALAKYIYAPRYPVYFCIPMIKEIDEQLCKVVSEHIY